MSSRAMAVEVLSECSALLSFRPVAGQSTLAPDGLQRFGRIQEKTTNWTFQCSLTVGCGVGQLVEVAKRPEDFSILFTDMLFRTAGRANLLRVPSTYHLKPGAAEILRARILRATACFHIVCALSLSCACVQSRSVGTTIG